MGKGGPGSLGTRALDSMPCAGYFPHVLSLVSHDTLTWVLQSLPLSRGGIQALRGYLAWPSSGTWEVQPLEGACGAFLGIMASARAKANCRRAGWQGNCGPGAGWSWVTGQLQAGATVQGECGHWTRSRSSAGWRTQEEATENR